jgi:hypothetical protein
MSPRAGLPIEPETARGVSSRTSSPEIFGSRGHVPAITAVIAQQVACCLGLAAPLAKRPVELDKPDAETFQLVADLIERRLGRARQRAEHHRDERHQHGDDKLGEISRLPAPAGLGQERANKQAHRGIAKQNEK